MTQIFRNLKSMWKYQKNIFILAILCIFISTVIILFSMGIYQHFEKMIEGDLKFYDSHRSYVHMQFPDRDVTKEELKNCLLKVSEGLDDIAGYGNRLEFVEMSMNADWGYDVKEFQNYDPTTWEEKVAMVVRVGLEQGQIVAPHKWFEGISSCGSLVGTSGWSDAQEAAGDHVAFFSKEDQLSTIDFPKQKRPDEDENIQIDGVTYHVMGYSDWDYSPSVPFGSLPDSQKFFKCSFYFSEYVTQNTFDYITGLFRETLGDRMIIEDEKLDRENIYYTYKTVMQIEVLICVVAILNFMILYIYIMEKRAKTTRIFSLCGLSKWKAYWINMGEILVLSVPVYLIANVVFSAFILPRMKHWFRYMAMAYNLPVYIELFMIYLAVLWGICSIFICYKNKKIFSRI